MHCRENTAGIFKDEFCEIGKLKGMIATGMQWPDIIINTHTPAEYRTDIKGTFSLFSCEKGQAYYGADNKFCHVNEDTFFLSNEGQPYGIDISSRVETFNIHFSTGMLQKIAGSYSGNEQLLDNGTNTLPQNMFFHNMLYWKDEQVKKIFSILKSKNKTGEFNRLMSEELLAALLNHLIAGQNKYYQNVAGLSVAKVATRQEVIKRINTATDYMYCGYMTDISLDELAHVACMSKYHFLRMFKEMHRCTPYQYLVNIRLNKAKSLLVNNYLPVKDIALLVGYEYESVFCRAFRRMYGYSPGEYRALA